MDIEHELKISLDKNKFDSILSQSLIIKKIPQINFYFDTSELYFSKNKITLRVRRENTSFTLTLKIKNQSNSLITKSYEYNISMDSFDDINIHNNILNIIKALNLENIPDEIKKVLPNIQYIGSISNIRHVLLYNDKYHFELDETIFLESFKEYEMEIENYNENFLPLLEKFNLESKNINNSSKYDRFLKYFNSN